jgi:hypothetical protein
MLKKSASSVLASFRSSTYPRGYASVLHSLRPCWTAFLSILGECFPIVPHVPTIKVLAGQHSFPAACYVQLAGFATGATGFSIGASGWAGARNVPRYIVTALASASLSPSAGIRVSGFIACGFFSHR